MSSKTQTILNLLHVVSWLIFAGLCIFTGTILFNIIYTLFINPEDARSFYRGIDFGPLYDLNKGIFATVALLMAFVAALKAYMFYVIIKAVKALNLVQPFSSEVGGYIFRVAYVALFIGVISLAGISFTGWLREQQVHLPDMHYYLGGGDVLLLMGIILFVIAQIFKRGIEIQTENALTV